MNQMNSCDTCTRPFIAKKPCTWVFPPPESSVMINGNKGNTELPIGWIGSDGDSDCGIVPFQNILKNSKKIQKSCTLAGHFVSLFWKQYF